MPSAPVAADPGSQSAGGDSPGPQVARVDPNSPSKEAAAERLSLAIHTQYDRTKREFLRFIREYSHITGDFEARRVSDIIVSEVVSIGGDGWVAELDYYVIDRSHKPNRRDGRFLVRQVDDRVEFIRPD